MTPRWLIRVLRAAGIGRPTFAAGQVWRYATREGEEPSRVHVLRVDTHPKTGDAIVHIAISGVRLPSWDASAPRITTISHVPISREALEGSGLSLEATSVALPEFEEGYRMWREAFDAGNAGVFTIAVAAVVDAMEQAVQRGS